MKFSIFSYCSYNYKDAFDFVIKSWRWKSGASQIFLYTDGGDIIPNLPDVYVIPFFKKSDDWLTSTSRKATAMLDVFNRVDNENIMFIDVDCYIHHSLGHVFNKDFDFAVTRLKPQRNVYVSTGIFFFRNNEKCREFAATWIALTKQYEIEKKGAERKNSYSQWSFSDLIRERYKKSKNKIVELDVNIYNRKTRRAILPEMLEDIKSNKIKVYHLYNQAFRDQECINTVFKHLRKESHR